MADNVQVIGLIQPDRAPSRAAAVGGEPPRRQGPRWVPRAVLAFGAVVVVTAVIWSADTDPVAGPDDTVATTTTRPLLQPAGPAPAEQVHFAADAPTGWSVLSADELTPAEADSSYLLWSAPGEMTVHGRWISVSITPSVRDFEVATDATRSLVGDFEATTPLSDALRRDVRVPLLVGTATIAARGIDDALLITLADSLQSTGATLQLASLLPADFELVARGADLESLFIGDPVSRVIYTSDSVVSEPVDVTLTVGTAGALEPSIRVSPFIVTDIRRAADLLSGTLAAHPDQRVLRWRSGKYVFVLSGPVTIAELNQFAAAVRPVDTSEWEQMLYGRPPGTRLLSLQPIASGTTTDGREWSAGVGLFSRNERTLLLWAASMLDDPRGLQYIPPLDEAATPSDSIRSLVIPGATYVFASTTSTAPGFLLEVRVAGRVERLPFVDVGVEGVRVAAYAFTEPLPFVATAAEG